MSLEDLKIKERVLYFGKLKGITQLKLCSIINMSHGNFKGEAKKTPLNSDAIATLFTTFRDLNLEWLLIGTGEPIKKNIPETLIENNDKDSVLVARIEELTRENEHLRMENQIFINQHKQTHPKHYLEPDAPALKVAESGGDYGTKK